MTACADFYRQGPGYQVNPENHAPAGEEEGGAGKGWESWKEEKSGYEAPSFAYSPPSPIRPHPSFFLVPFNGSGSRFLDREEGHVVRFV